MIKTLFSKISSLFSLPKPMPADVGLLFGVDKEVYVPGMSYPVMAWFHHDAFFLPHSDTHPEAMCILFPSSVLPPVKQLINIFYGVEVPVNDESLFKAWLHRNRKEYAERGSVKGFSVTDLTLGLASERYVLQDSFTIYTHQGFEQKVVQAIRNLDKEIKAIHEKKNDPLGTPITKEINKVIKAYNKLNDLAKQPI